MQIVTELSANFRCSSHRVPRHVLFFEAGNGLRVGRDGHWIAREKDMKTLPSGLARVAPVRLQSLDHEILPYNGNDR